MTCPCNQGSAGEVSHFTELVNCNGIVNIGIYPSLFCDICCNEAAEIRRVRGDRAISQYIDKSSVYEICPGLDRRQDSAAAYDDSEVSYFYVVLGEKLKNFAHAV